MLALLGPVSGASGGGMTRLWPTLIRFGSVMDGFAASSWPMVSPISLCDRVQVIAGADDIRLRGRDGRRGRCLATPWVRAGATLGSGWTTVTQPATSSAIDPIAAR